MIIPPEMVECYRHALQTICLSALLAICAGVGLWKAYRLLRPSLASLSDEWRISKAGACLRTAICGGGILFAAICGGTKNNQANAPARVPAPQPAVQSVLYETNGDVHEEAVEAFDLGPGAPVSTNGFQIAEYIFTNGVMDVTVAWPNILTEGAVEAAYGDSLTNKTFLGCWRVQRDQRALRILARPGPLGLTESGFVWIRPAKDSDSDGASDWYEVYGLGSSMTLADSDSDGIPDEFEAALGLNPAVDDYEAAPKLRVGGGGGVSLRSALGSAAPYSIIEVSPGVYSVNDLHLPDMPVLITTPNRGRNRQVVFRSTSTYALGIRRSSKSRIVIQGVRFDLERDGNLQAGIWLGEPLMFGGEGASVRILNCRFMMSRPSTHYFGIYSRGWSEQQLVIAGCEFNALGSSAVRGVSLVDSPDVYVEGCSFMNFPKDGRYESSAIHYETTSDNRGGMPDVARLGVVNTLFDNTFTNAYVLAPMVAGNAYEVSMNSCVVPSVPEYDAHTTSNIIVGNVSVNSRGYLLPGSAGIGQGIAPIYSTIDVNGVTRGDAVDIGAARYIDPTSNQDTDQDGLRDWDEIDHHQTDPGIADTDGDHISDGGEVAEGTDPLDRNDYCFSATIRIENPARELTPASVALFAEGFSTNRPVSMVVYATNDVTILTIPHRRSHGECPYRIVAWYDENANGELDDERIYVTSAYSPSGHEDETLFCLPSLDEDTDLDGLSNWEEIVVLGTNPRKKDTDGDMIPDGVEVVEATSPLDSGNYCFDLSVEVTNRLDLVDHFGFAIVLSESGDIDFLTEPHMISGIAGEVFGFPHQLVVDGRSRYLGYWYDRNTNGVWDVDSEVLNLQPVKIIGHDMNRIRITLDSRMYDFDRDEMPDWWELTCGLDPYDSGDSFEDPDGDGLINVYEYWLGFDPCVCDGTNTLLSLCSRSVDRRIENVDAMNAVSRFTDYLANAPSNNFIANTNFWAGDIDVSCVSVWNSGRQPGSMSATAITRKHVVMANHWYSTRYWFCDTNGVISVRSVVSSVAIENSDMRLGRLDEDLPLSIKMPKILPLGIEGHLKDGKYLPAVCMNHLKGFSIQEINRLNGHLTFLGGLDGYGTISATNSVSLARAAVRGATIDGNSGSPVFLIAGDELIFLFSKHLGMSGKDVWTPWWGPNISPRADQIRAKIQEWEGEDAIHYQLNVFDVSGFDVGNIGAQ